MLKQRPVVKEIRRYEPPKRGLFFCARVKGGIS